MPKIFIFNGESTAPESISDCKELFIQHSILDNPEVILTDFKQNFDGLDAVKDNSTLIIPGGAALYMTWAMRSEQADQLRSLNSKGFNYVGICAGGFLGTANADMFDSSYIVNSNNSSASVVAASSSQQASATASNSTTSSHFKPFTRFTTAREQKANLDFLVDYSAIGPFTPNDNDYREYTEKELAAKGLKPYCTNLSVGQAGETLPQLYVLGCGFVPSYSTSASPQAGSEIVARYAEKNQYSFNYKYSFWDEIKTHHSLPAIIRSRNSARDNKRGNVLLSGTHIESCVKDSKMLGFFKPTNKHERAFTLSETGYTTLESAQEKCRDYVIPLLRDTLKR